VDVASSTLEAIETRSEGSLAIWSRRGRPHVVNPVPADKKVG
jgi:hypothetical protein